MAVFDHVLMEKRNCSEGASGRCLRVPPTRHRILDHSSTVPADYQDNKSKARVDQVTMTTVAANLGSLTTTFTPPNDCNLISVQIDSFSDGSQVYNLFMYNLGWVSAQRCFPPGYVTDAHNGATDTAYYSLGVCP